MFDLDVADKLGSVFSALFGLLGVLLTALGLWEPAKHRFRRARTRALNAYEERRERRKRRRGRMPRAGTSTRSGIYIPTRGESVPDSSHLPSRPRRIWVDPHMRGGPVWHWRRLVVVVVGLTLLALAALAPLF